MLLNDRHVHKKRRIAQTKMELSSGGFRHKPSRAVNRELERLFAYPGMVNGAAARYINYNVLFDSRDGCCARSRRS